VIRRHPEIRQRSLREVEDLLSIQTKILNNLAGYVRPGGTLLYSTCSVLRDEDEGQITAFLDNRPEFRLVPVELKGFDCENGMLRSWPHRSGNDGFFAARLVKKND
jgi:16S rRNA (cytosine967-C5)-methyltransferase